MKELLDFSRTLICMSVILWILFGFIIGIEKVSNDDMKPRLFAGDIIIYYRLDKSHNVREIIVLKKNENRYIGRVVAAGGDKVEITDDSVLMVNDNMVTEDYITLGTPGYDGFADYPVILEADECFVLCDRRDGSEDSRYYGPVKDYEILGTMICQYRRGST